MTDEAEAGGQTEQVSPNFGGPMRVFRLSGQGWLALAQGSPGATPESLQCVVGEGLAGFMADLAGSAADVRAGALPRHGTDRNRSAGSATPQSAGSGAGNPQPIQ